MLKIKVCGMREEGNIQAISQLSIDFIGFIFYEKSARYVSDFPKDLDFKNNPLDRDIYKVGVFVDAPKEEVLDKVKEYGLDYVQLHGRESVFYCEFLKKQGVKIIKAFSIDERFVFTNTDFYAFSCDYFLFDTKGKNPGGNGTQFNWELLKKYDGDTPFFLSGGIDESSATKIRQLDLPKLFGVDINSKFEIKPALKDMDKLRHFVADLKQSSDIMDYYN